MTGKYIYFAVAALLGVLAALIHFLPYFMLSILYLFVLHHYKKFQPYLLSIITAVWLVFFLFGFQVANHNHTKIPETVVSFSLEYMQDPKIDGDLLQIQAKERVYKEKLLIRYKMNSQQEKEDLKDKSFYGYVCELSGDLKKPKIAKNPNGFDYRKYLKTKEIYWIVESKENPLNNCTPVKRNSPFTLIQDLRFKGIHYLEKQFPTEIASLSSALIFGERGMLSPDLQEDYQKTGLVHLLAISGLHVSLLIGMVFYMGIRLGLTRQTMTNFLLMVLPVYVILTGASSSVVRAGLMIFLVLAIVKWKNQLKLLPLDAISLACIIYLAFNPLVLFDVGFQLSFTVSAAIILSAKHIMGKYSINFIQMIVISVASQLTALPFLLYHFFGLSFIGIVANLIYIPLFSYVYLPGLYGLFFIQLVLGWTPGILIKFFLAIITLFNNLIASLADLNFTALVPGRPNLFFLLFDIVVIICIFYIWEKRGYSNRKWHLVGLSAALLTFQSGWNWADPFGEVTMIDVGQGDSIFIHFPRGGGNYLIDTGGTMNFVGENWRQRAKPYEVGRDVVVPFLKGKGITKIDKLILTHGDMDHIGGANSIIKELKVEEILLPSVAEPSAMEEEIKAEAEKKGINIVHVSSGYRWGNADHQFYILSPDKNFKGERNSGSLAIFARFGGLAWFFGGDLDKLGEERIIQRYPELTVDVLKAGHHGSKTSSSEAFLRQIKPKAAFISVGEENRFGHPHQEVIKLLNEVNAVIYRTDLQGAITYSFYRNRGTFSTFLP
ncbi:DNA internalization-related competence protein ComEC/Rec2 [Neobacillus sp. 114]|uniref:DNA internalization-related competence protein ComEC/Rec2 n=1 Tax=Neobacillus sp. 114 TaxID=3048535 RepID=UPI0024C2669E|nr:DNA internalization-related competence protein ComEC/Rec2 [Neobacillus sp. 114]